MEILSLLSLTFSLMKNLLLLSVVLAVVGISSVSAATGSTSTGSTSTGSTSTGTTSTGVTSTGVTSTGITVVTASVKWAGGPTRAWNYTTKSFDMVPQCFPWVWLLEYYKGNIFSMYENQNKCRAQRFVDFGL